MDEFYQSVKIQPQVDEKALNQASSSMESSATQAFAGFMKSAAKVGVEFNRSFTNGFSSGTSTLSKQIYKFGTDFNDIASAFLTDWKAGLMEVANKFLERLGNLISDSLDELNTISNYSRLSNAHTRQLAFTYGFSGAQGYGYDKAMSLMGYGSLEDLMYANAKEQKMFRELFMNYTDKYNKLYDSGFFDTLVEYNVEMTEFEEELKMEVVQFIMENKDLIHDGMEAIMFIAKIVLQFTSKAMDFMQAINPFKSYKSSYESATTGDVIKNYTTSNKSVKVDNTFNYTGNMGQDAFYNSGQLILQQMIAALK